MTREDVSGKRFGKLTAIKLTEPNKWGKTRWLCSCDCGKQKVFILTHLKSGMTKSCGCLRNRPAHNAIKIAGNKYGMLTVLRRLGSKENGKKSAWLCRCDCGKEKVLQGTAVKSGSVKSCGCLLHIVKRGKESPLYKRGYSVNPDGYKITRGKNRDGRWTSRPQHAVVMENHIGRKLHTHETVHHKNGIKHDNRIDNLELWSGKHPRGQRVEDMIAFCVEYLSEYAPGQLAFVEERKCAVGI